MTKTNILLVCATPRGTDPLRTTEEDRTLRESLRLSPHRDDFEVQTLNAATIDDLRRALLWKQFDIVQFSGHGTHTGLVFEDAQGKLMVPSSVAIAELLQRRGVRIAVLNACYSLSVGTIAAIGLDHTIASTGPISDPGAIEFTRGFYDALGAKVSVTEAYAEGVSAARLKGFEVDTVLLNKGEEYSPPQRRSAPSVGPRAVEMCAARSLLGIAIDASGSMQTSMRNHSGMSATRFAEVKVALADIGRQVQDGYRHPVTDGNEDDFQVFLYAFGLRVGCGVADLASLWRATQRIHLAREVERRRQRHEAEAMKMAQRYSGVANVVRQFGYGGLIESVARATESSIREKIVGEVAALVMDEAGRVGEQPLSAQQLVALFDETPSSLDPRLLDHVLFGATPMRRAAEQLRDRFHRIPSAQFDHRTLLIISDGEPTDGDPKPAFAEMRSAGVTMVSCFVTNDDVANPRVLHAAPLPNWTAGARLMWDIASRIDESGPAAAFLLANGWSIEKDARLFVQVNHSDVLKEFASACAHQLARTNAFILPRGS